MLKNISKLASGSAISQLILVSSYPVITRIYSPQEFGQFTLLVTVVLFIAIASTLRLEFALPIELNVKLKSILFNMALKVLIIYIFILFILLFLTYLFNINIELNAFYLLISVFFVSFIRILNYNCISNAEFSIISKSLIIVSIVTVFTQFFFSLEFFNNLNGLEVELVYEWELGSMLIFDRTNLHCSSSVISGKKLGLTTFTKK